MSSNVISADEQAAIPFWRDIRVLSWGFQIIILVASLVGLFILGRNLVTNLAAIDLDLSLEFLSRPAGFNISEGAGAVNRTSPIRDAYLVGVKNTLRASAVGIILATILGVIVGIARLSQNWIVNKVALVFIEIMQNTPLLVQLFFWFALIKALPAQRIGEVGEFPGGLIPGVDSFVYFSQRGAAVPGIAHEVAFPIWFSVVILGLIAFVGAWIFRVRQKERAGRPPTGQVWFGTGAFLAVLAIGWLIFGQLFSITLPNLVGDPIANYEGGWQLSGSFQALLLGLVLYTAAFIAEVVRSGIQAVAKGQIEAATALGLSRGQQLRLIILPQAMRVAIPPLINQYLNLTKNSSLAIAVAYPDIYNVSQTIGNNTGQNTQIIGMVMGTYLFFSLSISFFMNFVNNRMQIKER